MLSQQEADDLIAMEKVIETTALEFPIPGDTLTLLAQSADGTERFQLDIERGRRNESRWKMQLR